MKVRNTINGYGNIARVEMEADKERDILNVKLSIIRSFDGRVTK